LKDVLEQVSCSFVITNYDQIDAQQTINDKMNKPPSLLTSEFLLGLHSSLCHTCIPQVTKATWLEKSAFATSP